ncbi:MAG: LPXTG cell wall anchor domain-containing protein, partial [Microbacteriaceae bacterium]
YRIVDAGLVRPFWVKGYAENFDGWSKYTGGSDCGIYDQNPETAPGDANQLKPVSVSPYTCTQTATEHVGGDRGNYQATFAVAKRDMTVVTEQREQKKLVSKYCADATNCGLSLVTVVPQTGVGRIVAGPVNNTTDTPSVLSLATTGSATITDNWNQELDITAGVNSFEGPAWSFAIKSSWGHTVANTTSTTQKVQITVLPHTSGWIVGSPPMVHTVGEIIVHDTDSGRYLDLTNLVADFPDATDTHNTWTYTPEGAPLPPSVGTGGQQGGTGAGSPIITPGNITPGNITPGNITPANITPNASAASRASSGLAQTGSSVDGTGLLGLIVLLAGIGVVAVRRRYTTRQHRRQSSN